MAKKIVHISRGDQNIKPQLLMYEFVKHGMRPSEMQLFRAKQAAIEVIDDNHAQSYCLLPNVNALKKGFLAGCEPFIGFYGYYLKGPCGGILLSTISLDANKGLFPIAFAIVEILTVPAEVRLAVLDYHRIAAATVLQSPAEQVAGTEIEDVLPQVEQRKGTRSCRRRCREGATMTPMQQLSSLPKTEGSFYFNGPAHVHSSPPTHEDSGPSDHAPANKPSADQPLSSSPSASAYESRRSPAQALVDGPPATVAYTLSCGPHITAYATQPPAAPSSLGLPSCGPPPADLATSGPHDAASASPSPTASFQTSIQLLRP
ncbi:hypothetical protein M9H77_03706 [Catharanthus roseus]|uniref:Uncharacterized protein n=1 Tax=Catharanthus roseus TaxID=4058 RepID=A0ACC0CBY0_CATRO|nr:hypothetical protein M9H77_03706 [Catharanthus roseus]